jgi:hypothetical protein
MICKPQIPDQDLRSYRCQSLKSHNYNLVLVIVPLFLMSRFHCIFKVVCVHGSCYKYDGLSKSSRNSLASTVWCIMSSYCLNKVLLVSMCSCFRGCGMLFRGSGAISGRQGQWFLHHGNAPSPTSLVVSSPRREKHSCHHPDTVLSGSRCEWRLAVPYSDNGPRGVIFRNQGGHQIECNGRIPKDSSRSLPPMLPTFAGSIEQVCTCARVLLWRWLDKLCRMSYHYSAIPPFRELFDCPS